MSKKAAVMQGDRHPGKAGKPGDIRELDIGRGKGRDLLQSQVKVREMYIYNSWKIALVHVQHLD